jgi:hypothetical protein
VGCRLGTCHSRHVGGVQITAWKTTLLATQWLLLSAQSTPNVIVPPTAQQITQAYEFAIETRNEGLLRLLNMLPPKELIVNISGAWRYFALTKRASSFIALPRQKSRAQI